MADIKSLKAKKFLPMLKDRQERFESGKAELSAVGDSAMALARALHPKRQYLRIEKVTERGEDCKSFTLVPDEEKGTTSLAYFGAGKYLREEVPHLAALQCCFHLIAIRCGGDTHLDIPAVQFFQEIDHTRFWLYCVKIEAFHGTVHPVHNVFYRKRNIIFLTDVLRRLQ